jgi:hypothetical protein
MTMYVKMLPMLALAAAALVLPSCSSDKAEAEKPLTVEESATVAMTSRVESVDYATRWITLRDMSGYTTSFVVGPQVQRLNEVKVGDSVRTEYNVRLEAELRAPTAEESANPIVITKTTSRAPSSSDPASGTQRRVKLVTTVEAVDLGRMHVTLKGPMGDTATIRAREQENIKRLHVGDTIVITYVEGSAISLVKATSPDSRR